MKQHEVTQRAIQFKMRKHETEIDWNQTKDKLNDVAISRFSNDNCFIVSHPHKIDINRMNCISRIQRRQSVGVCNHFFINWRFYAIFIQLNSSKRNQMRHTSDKSWSEKVLVLCAHVKYYCVVNISSFVTWWGCRQYCVFTEKKHIFRSTKIIGSCSKHARLQSEQNESHLEWHERERNRTSENCCSVTLTRTEKKLCHFCVLFSRQLHFLFVFNVLSFYFYIFCSPSSLSLISLQPKQLKKTRVCALCFSFRCWELEDNVIVTLVPMQHTSIAQMNANWTKREA